MAHNLSVAKGSSVANGQGGAGGSGGMVESLRVKTKTVVGFYQIIFSITNTLDIHW